MLGLDWTYDLVECAEPSSPACSAATWRDPDWAGLSLTMPLKSEALALADFRAPSAELVGVANTLVLADGTSTAHNTDPAGVVLALAELDVTGPPMAPVVLGGGGTARAVLAALAQLGAQDVRVAVRRPAAAELLVTLGERLSCGSTASPGRSRTRSSAAPTSWCRPPLRVRPTALAAGGWRADLPLLDVLYAPWPTALAAAARAAGAPVVGGLAMLVGQAAEQVQLMTGRPAPLAAMRAAGEAALAARTSSA